MRLVCSEYSIDFDIRENEVNVLVVESPNIFSHMISELICQIDGEAGNFVLSEQDAIINLSKVAKIIVNPFIIDCNEKRIQQKLYQELTDEMNETMIERTVYLQGEIITYLEELIKSVSYPLGFDIEENMTGLLKMCHVEIDDQGEVLVEKIMNYIKVLKQFCNIQIIFFVNLKAYLSQLELEELYKYTFYEKINLILMENCVKEKLENENICILDRDLCIINIE